jgi:hypothetical protein
LDKTVFPIFKGKTRVILSELKESDAAVLGASALGWEAKYRAEVPAAIPATPTADEAKEDTQA